MNSNIFGGSKENEDTQRAERKRALLEQEIRDELQRQMEEWAPRRSQVEVHIEEWEGYEPEPHHLHAAVPDWSLPVYITIEAPNYHFFDAVLDLDASTIEEQAKFAVEQAIKG